jgi:hypothetical protein
MILKKRISMNITNIDLFLKNLIKEAGMDKLPVKLQKQVYGDLTLKLNQKFYIFALDNLTERELIDLEQMVGNKASLEEVTSFLVRHIENFVEKSNEIMSEFKKNYLEVVNIKTVFKNKNKK